MIDVNNKYTISITRNLDTVKYIIKFYIELIFLLLKLYNITIFTKKIFGKNMNRNTTLSCICTLVLLWACFAVYDFDKYTILEVVVAGILDPIIIVLSLISILKGEYYLKIKNYLLASTFILGFYSLFWGFVGLSSRTEYNDIIFSSSEFISFFAFFTGIFLCWSVFKLRNEIK
tara:strand:+ start:777 stop:1298 length:522 start_codon:yes stop_codon:yes gene_type:complete